MSTLHTGNDGTDHNSKRPYKVEFQLKTREKKRLNSGTSYSAVAPPGYTFVPVGLPEITDYCKEKSRLYGLYVYVVSAKRNNKTGPDKISFHIHRIGHHFENKLVEDACHFYGYASSSRSYVRRNVNVEPSTHALAKRLNEHGKRPGMDALSSHERQLQQVRNTIKDLFPKIPEEDLQAIVKRAFEEGTTRVGTSDLPLPRKVQLAVVAHIRHNHTDYDRLLRETSWQEARSQVEAVCLQQIVKWRGEDEASEGALEDFMEEVIVLDDDDDTNHIHTHHDGRNREPSLEIVSSRTLVTDLTAEDDQVVAYSEDQRDMTTTATPEIIHVQPRRILANSQLLNADEMRRRYDIARTEVQQANHLHLMADTVQPQLINGTVDRDVPMSNAYGPVNAALHKRTFERRETVPLTEQWPMPGTSYHDPIILSSPHATLNGMQNPLSHAPLSQNAATAPRQSVHSANRPEAYLGQPVGSANVAAGNSSFHNLPAVRNGLGISDSYPPTGTDRPEASGYGYPRYFSPNMDIDHWPGRPQNIDRNRPRSVHAAPYLSDASHPHNVIQRPSKRSYPYEYEEAYSHPQKSRTVAWDGPETSRIQAVGELQRIPRLRIREQRPRSPYERLKVPHQRRPASPPPYRGQPSHGGPQTLYANPSGHGPEAIYIRRDEVHMQQPSEQSQLPLAARPVYVGNLDRPYRSTPPQRVSKESFIDRDGNMYRRGEEPPTVFYDITDQHQMQWEPNRSTDRHVEYRTPYL